MYPHGFCSDSLLIAQSNSLNLTPNNPEILIIRHLRAVVWRQDVLLFTRKKHCQWNRSRWGGMCKKASKSVCMSTIVVSCDLLHQLHQLWRQHKHKRGLWWLWRRYRNGIFVGIVVQLKYRSSNKKLSVSTLVSIGTVS